MAKTIAQESLKSVKQGDMICAQETSCYRGDEYCLVVTAYVENWNSDKTKYQLRISQVVTNLTLNGYRTVKVDGVNYREGEIIWVDFFERSGTIWVKCHSK